MDSVAAFDRWLFIQINSLVGVWPLFDRLMMTIVNEYFVTVTLSLMVVTLWFVGRTAQERMENQKAVLHAVLAQAVTNAIIKANNLLYFRPRPFADMEVNLLFYKPTDSSMPSNPAAVGFAFATVVWSVNRRVGLVSYVLAVLFAFSRVYCGVHYPLDVVGGALVGTVGAAIAIFLGRRAFNPAFEWIIRLGRRLYLA